MVPTPVASDGATSRRTLYVSAFVAASLAYIFVALAFTGRFDVWEWTVFAAVFLVGLYIAERLLNWAELRG